MMNWDKFDELFASFARPISIYICTGAVAAACFGSQAAIAIPIAGAIAGGAAVLRTVDIKTKATAASEDKKTAAQSIPPGPIKTAEVS